MIPAVCLYRVGQIQPAKVAQIQLTKVTHFRVAFKARKERKISTEVESQEPGKWDKLSATNGTFSSAIDIFYGRTFHDLDDLEGQSQSWLQEVANCRIHGTTGEIPLERWGNTERGSCLPIEGEREL